MEKYINEILGLSIQKKQFNKIEKLPSYLQEEYNDLVDKVMIYIDYIVKYNTVLYRKKIQQLLNSKRKLEIIHKLNYFENIAYTFDLFISKKELDEMINKLNV